MFRKIWEESGLEALLPFDDVYITSFNGLVNDVETDSKRQDHEIVFDFIKNNPSLQNGGGLQGPPFVVPLDERSLYLLCPETKKRNQPKVQRVEGSLDKWAGSLLSSPYFTHPHYIIGSQHPTFVVGNWWYRDIQLFIDFGHLKDEFDYYLKNKQLQPLPTYTFTVQPGYKELYYKLHSWYEDKTITHLSVDIETIGHGMGKNKNPEYPFKENNGLPYLIGIAPNGHEAISFCIWDYTPMETVELLRILDKLFLNKRIIGQNFFNFDVIYLRAMGFRFGLNPFSCTIEDTIIKHHILWSELEHKLQFLTKQYTRQPYYKDEAHSFNPKHKESYMKYNCLDCCITYEASIKMDAELKDRGLV